MQNELVAEVGPDFGLNSGSEASSDVEAGTPISVDFGRIRSIKRKDAASTTSTEEHWSEDIEGILEDIRSNSEILAKHHKIEYMKLQSQLVYFRVPLIIISALNSVFSVGLNAYIEQTTVSTVNCLLSLTCACISSVELFLQIQKRLEVELNSYHGYYLLGTKISAMLKLKPSRREVEGSTFLNSTINDYNNLFEQSCVSGGEFTDLLVAFPRDPSCKEPPPPSSLNPLSRLKGIKRKPTGSSV
jgi:hypothetical protein